MTDTERDRRILIAELLAEQAKHTTALLTATARLNELANTSDECGRVNGMVQALGRFQNDGIALLKLIQKETERLAS